MWKDREHNALPSRWRQARLKDGRYGLLRCAVARCKEHRQLVGQYIMRRLLHIDALCRVALDDLYHPWRPVLILSSFLSNSEKSALARPSETNEAPWVHPTPFAVASNAVEVGAGVTDNAVNLSHRRIPQRAHAQLPIASTVA